MDVNVTVSGPDSGDELRSLYTWLTGDDELRGRARLVTSSPPQGTLGSVAELLTVALGPGGISAALAAGLVAWLRQRTGDVTVTAWRHDGQKVELTARRVHGVDTGQLRDLIASLATEIEEPDKANGNDAGTEGSGQ